MEPFDLAIIGSGPGGYVAAIYAGQIGMKVVCIEKEKTFGGTCLNVGCIPSKALLHSTEYYNRVHVEGKIHGIEYKELSVNFPQMMSRKEKVVEGLTQGIAFLFKKNKVASLQGEARLIDAHTIAVGKEKIEAKSIILATGSEPIALPFLPFDEKRVLSSTGALALPKIPKKMVIVGAGIIGLELGSVYRRLGTEIVVVELLDRVTPTLDADISKAMFHILKKQGMEFHLSTKVKEAKIGKNSIELTLEGKDPISGEVILVSIGRKPYSKGLGLEEIGIEKDKFGRVKIDGCFRTSIPHIYAIGDLIDGPMLAHKASEEGMAAVDFIAGNKRVLNYLAIPNVMYTWPEVASVGMTEEEAKEDFELLIGKAPFKAIPRARCSGDEEGFLKILADKKSERIIGVHIVGANASEMIHEGVIAIENKMTLDQLSSICHAHPTGSEAFREAALAAKKRSIDF